MTALTQPDAGMYWRSLHAANDQFLLYAFDAPTGAADPIAELRVRAARIADLHLGIARVPGDLDYPRWIAAPIRECQWRRHDVADWDGCLAAVAALMTPGSREPDVLWRVHVFGPLDGVPEAKGRATVVVLQISHALGDGRRVSEIARTLLSDGPAEPAHATRPRMPAIVAAGIGVATTVPRLAVATAIGLGAWRADDPDSGPSTIAPTAVNLPGDGPTELRTITVPRARLAPSVTVAVLAALADVLPRFGGATADGRVVAELTVARDPVPGQRNNFHTVGIDLRSGEAGRVRAQSIVDQIAAARRRDSAAARRRSRRAAAAAPAGLDALAVRLAEQAPLPTRVAGATVVSSVNRGPADLTSCGGRVLFTAGFPALSPVHGLTHGVHGIGERVTVSIAARGRAAETIDEYARALASALA